MRRTKLCLRETCARWKRKCNSLLKVTRTFSKAMNKTIRPMVLKLEVKC